jgi:GNAT superfamily N-acetyltransferase
MTSDRFTLPSLNAFLAGEGRTIEDLDIDPIFGKSVAKILWDVTEFEPDAVERTGPETPSLNASGYMFRGVESGVLLLSPDGAIVGCYAGCDLAVDPVHRGKGLGAELVAEFFLRHGGIPVTDHDKPSYSPAGYGAHCAGHRLLSNPEFVNQKLAGIDASEAPEEFKPKSSI